MTLAEVVAGAERREIGDEVLAQPRPHVLAKRLVGGRERELHESMLLVS